MKEVFTGTKAEEPRSSSTDGQFDRRAFLNLGVKGAIGVLLASALPRQAFADELPKVIRNKDDFEKVAWAEYREFERSIQEAWRREQPRWTAAQKAWSEARGKLTGQDLLHAEIQYQTAKKDYYRMKEQECDYRYMKLQAKYLGRPTYFGRQGSQTFYEQDEQRLQANTDYKSEYDAIYQEEASYVAKMQEAERRVFELETALGNVK